MATNPTKILLYDLDADLGKLMDSLKQFQGTYTSIYDRMMDLGTDTFSDEVKEVIDDLIDGYQDSGILTIQRIENLRADIEAKLLALATDGGNYDEHFTYDAQYGNVTKHEVTGDKEFTVDYNYTSLATGELSDSIQKYKNTEGKWVTVKKTYTYDTNGNITDIHTTTTVDETSPAEVTGFTATSPSAGRVNFVWLNPTDTDFDHVEIYMDAEATRLYASLNKTEATGSVTGVPAGTHTFTIKTVDTSGNKSTGVTSSTVTVA